uniref:Uncharacterized protein n=1 Tax=Rhizophora mucronata TaxID=61149 RepID=A0A2P2IWF3_RHIMU
MQYHGHGLICSRSSSISFLFKFKVQNSMSSILFF